MVNPKTQNKMKNTSVTPSEFASTLDVNYNKLRAIGITAKNEVKDLILNAEYALHNAIKCEKHAPQNAPSAYGMREGSETQQAIGRAEAKKIIDAVGSLDFPDMTSDTKKHISECVEALTEYLAKTEPVVVPEPEVKTEEEGTPKEKNETEITPEGETGAGEKKSGDGPGVNNGAEKTE